MDDQGNVVIGFLGCGNIGGALYRLLQDKPIPLCTVKTVVVSKPARDGKHRFLARDVHLSNQLEDVLQDEEIDVIVESIGPPVGGFSLKSLAESIQEAMRRGKSVVTSNKQLVALYWRGIVGSLAQTSSVTLGIEACVAGGIPVIEPLRAQQRLDEIITIIGVVNATSNYILTLMEKNRRSLDQAREQAQQRGLSELDDSADLDGDDARFKIAILASIAFRTVVRPDDITWKDSIREVGQDVFVFARNFGYQLKPIVLATLLDGHLEIGVYPALLTADHPLAKVDGDYNAVLVKGSKSGWHMFYGKGAGPGPTSSSMYNDLARAVENVRGKSADPPILITRELIIRPRGVVERKGFFHALAPDQPGNLAKIAIVLASHNINVRQFDQINMGENSGTANASNSPSGMPIMLSTDIKARDEIEGALKEIQELPDFSNVIYFPIEEWESTDWMGNGIPDS